MAKKFAPQEKLGTAIDFLCSLADLDDLLGVNDVAAHALAHGPHLRGHRASVALSRASSIPTGGLTY
jgi:hypothetical protein